MEWDDGLPIYRQLMERLLTRILDGSYPEGSLLPSVRQLATDFGVNPLTAAKAFQELAKEEVTEKRRGIGVMVRQGVQKSLKLRERAKFLRDEWPQLKAKLERLEIDIDDLMGEN